MDGAAGGSGQKHIRQIAEVQSLQVSKQMDSALTAARDMGNSALALRERAFPTARA
jgi:Flp pilus assembly protein CpaB